MLILRRRQWHDSDVYVIMAEEGRAEHSISRLAALTRALEVVSMPPRSVALGRATRVISL